MAKNGVKKPVRKPKPENRPKPPLPPQLQQDLFDKKPEVAKFDKPPKFKEVQKKPEYKPVKHKKEVQHSDIYIFLMCMLGAAAILIAAGLLSNVVGFLLNGG